MSFNQTISMSLWKTSYIIYRVTQQVWDINRGQAYENSQSIVWSWSTRTRLIFCFSKARITQLQYSKAHLTYLTQLIFGYSKARIPYLNIPKLVVVPNQIEVLSGICLVTL